MGKSQRLRRSDELRILRTVDECRDLGDDAVAWQAHLSDVLRALTGSVVVGSGLTPPPGLSATLDMTIWTEHSFTGGWPSEATRDRWLSWARSPERVREHPALLPFYATRQRDRIAVRQELVDDAHWHGSAFVNETLRPDGFDEGMLAMRPVPGLGGEFILVLMREAGVRTFSEAQIAVVRKVQDAIHPHLGKALLLTTQPNTHGLSPRCRAVLDALLDGDAEKAVALRLGLRASTVHGYVKVLYEHFGVNSRAELLAYFLRRYRTSRPE